LPDKQRKAVKKAIKKNLISNDPAGLDVRRLLPHPPEFRRRVGKVRVLFKSTSEQLFIFKAHYRGRAYKKQ
jgi:mRNA interferase RelE/StbE